MHKLTDPSFQSRLAAQESSESVRESVGMLNPVTTTHSLESEWRRAIQIAKALARPHLHLWILLLVYTSPSPPSACWRTKDMSTTSTMAPFYSSLEVSPLVSHSPEQSVLFCSRASRHGKFGESP